MSQTAPAPAGVADDAALVVAFLQSHNAVCPRCKYNLRNLASPRCPECGHDLRLAIAGAPARPIFPWALLLMTASAVAGLGVLFAAICLVDEMPRFLRDPHRWDDITLLCLCLYSLLAIPGTLLILFVRPLFARLPIVIQYLLAIPFLLLNLALFVLFCFVGRL
ncbi:MAG TPA: hypothetical protein VH253_20710 [Phycisphaerae bacterium]|nr:hypothetical protein [Phycisphaerae bacterium]